VLLLLQNEGKEGAYLTERRVGLLLLLLLLHFLQFLRAQCQLLHLLLQAPQHLVTLLLLRPSHWHLLLLVVVPNLLPLLLLALARTPLLSPLSPPME
jgi:hypothetical protein